MRSHSSDQPNLSGWVNTLVKLRPPPQDRQMTIFDQVKTFVHEIADKILKEPR